MHSLKGRSKDSQFVCLNCPVGAKEPILLPLEVEVDQKVNKISMIQF